MKPVRISAVSYLNTLPFIHGLKNYNPGFPYSLELHPPAITGKMLMEDKADIGLVPSGLIPFLPNHRIITDFCIGANRKVKSVILVSEVPASQIKSVFLDYESETSVRLIKLIARLHWAISPKWVKASEGFENKIKESAGGVIIGDRALQYRDRFPYCYDLAGEWYSMTGLPFVFACWMAQPRITDDKAASFGKSLDFGVHHSSEIAEKDLPVSLETAHDYFQNCISYFLDSNKFKGLELFLKLLKI